LQGRKMVPNKLELFFAEEGNDISKNTGLYREE
jgi:hypothetical protein